MQSRFFLLFAVLALVSRSAFAEAKAYEVVKYKGKAEGVTIAVDYGDGYPQATKMTVTDKKRGKSRRFVLDDSGELRFVPENDRHGKTEVVLKMSIDDSPEATIESTYTVDGKQTQITLRKIE
jgi:hypothetical protein